MKHHKFRFGIKGNIKVLFCRIFGHKLNNNPQNLWCERCGLAYEEIYHPSDYYGIMMLAFSKDIKEVKDDLWDYQLIECPICTKKWVAIYPAGTTQLECPNCHCIKDYKL